MSGSGAAGGSSQEAGLHKQLVVADNEAHILAEDMPLAGGSAAEGIQVGAGRSAEEVAHTLEWVVGMRQAAGSYTHAPGDKHWAEHRGGERRVEEHSAHMGRGMDPCKDPGTDLGPDPCRGLGMDHDKDLDRDHDMDPEPEAAPRTGQAARHTAGARWGVALPEVVGILGADSVAQAGCTQAVPVAEALHSHERGSPVEPRKLEEADSHDGTCPGETKPQQLIARMLARLGG